MSRFKKEERENYQRVLIEIGKELFNQYGLMAISVDDIVKEVGIGKGTFYHFYNNKEHLYMDICNRIQDKIFSDANVYLERNLNPREKFQEILKFIFNELVKYPMISNMDENAYIQLQNKVPKACKDCNELRDLQMTKMISQSGIQFKVPPEKVTKIIQILFIDKTLLLERDDTDTIDILIEAVCQHII